ncbi:MAG: 30S ribosomal protein S1 [Holosporales bacterium]|jgi:small subunit ribosomal protein S1
MAVATVPTPSREAVAELFGNDTFAGLLDATLGTEGTLVGAVLRGTVVGITGDFVLVDVGLKSEGRVSLREFSSAPEGVPNVGEEVDVYVERYEDRNGEMQLSREKARREEIWVTLERAFVNAERVNGTIFGKVKGGLTVDLTGVVAFLPNSQIDVRPVRDIAPLMNIKQPFQILKLDRKRGNIVVSRRTILEESRAEARSDFVAGLSEGQVLEGTVKNLTDYGAFVDLGGVDGLLHVTDISWKRVSHPSEALTIGQKITVQVIRFNPDTKRISLGMKQLSADPWEAITERLPTDSRHSGPITSITEYGVFVGLGDGIEGLVHVSELSWTIKGINPNKLFQVGQEISVVVLEVDHEKRRVSLGIKQLQESPWPTLVTTLFIGSTTPATVKSMTDAGIIVTLSDDIDAFIATNELDKTPESYTAGEELNVHVLDLDVEKEKLTLSTHAADAKGKGKARAIPVVASITEVENSGGYKKAQIVTCTVTSIDANGIEVKIGENTSGYIKKADLSRDRSEQRSDRFAVGEKVDAQITATDAKSGRLTLSVKAREIAEEKQALKEYGSTDSGASLGDILGQAMRQAKTAKAGAKK